MRKVRKTLIGWSPVRDFSGSGGNTVNDETGTPIELEAGGFIDMEA